MPADYLHNHKQFPELIRIVAGLKSIDPALVEKDYWIMHSLYGLQKLGLTFELKGGTSLSKGFKIIDRFSEDIDIHIDPPADRDVKTGRNQDKPAHVKSRKDFYDWLADTKIRIDGIDSVKRDTAFDSEKLFSGGIRLRYRSFTSRIDDLKEDILLEAGFDAVTPNTPRDISSWIYDHAADRVDTVDNRAKGVACYDPGYTFVEKLQTISTKYRQQQKEKQFPPNFLRHYYDIYSLIERPEVQAFIGTDEYVEHKNRRFRSLDNKNIVENQAFILSDAETRKTYTETYAKTSALYYGRKPTFDQILERISGWIDRL
jgi:nucleotidyltransferase AbiEii toxin of type IV toxin-antitoxin system